MSLKNQVRSQIPEHIRDKYPLFVQFMELYFGWMEQTGQPYERIKNHLNYSDFLVNYSEYVEQMQKELMPDIPKNFVVDEKILVRHIKDFYQKKGTEDSIRFIFKILFNDESANVYYPREDILRISDDGRLSSEKKLQDSFYYQAYAYEISSDLPVEQWEDVVKKVCHVAGMKLFTKQN